MNALTESSVLIWELQEHFGFFFLVEEFNNCSQKWIPENPINGAGGQDMK